MQLQHDVTQLKNPKPAATQTQFKNYGSQFLPLDEIFLNYEILSHNFDLVYPNFFSSSGGNRLP